MNKLNKPRFSPAILKWKHIPWHVGSFVHLIYERTVSGFQLQILPELKHCELRHVHLFYLKFIIACAEDILARTRYSLTGGISHTVPFKFQLGAQVALLIQGKAGCQGGWWGPRGRSPCPSLQSCLEAAALSSTGAKMDLRHFFSLKEKMTDGVISIFEWRKFCGKHFLFNVYIKVGVGKGAEHMTFNMDPEWCVSMVNLETAHLPA